MQTTVGAGGNNENLRNYDSDRVLDEAMKARVLPKIPDLEIECEAVHTWHIENYRLLSKKERGPKFDCGGHPWCVLLECPSLLALRYTYLS